MGVLNTNTYALYSETGVSSSFTTASASIDYFLGFSISFVLTNATADFDMSLTLEATACDNDNWATVTGSLLHFAGNDTVIYNVSQVYYKGVKVVVNIVAGSADILVEINKKN